MSLLLLAVAVAVWYAAQPTPHRESGMVPPRADIERDLKLVFQVSTSDVTAGRGPWVPGLVLVNTSETATYRVVKPGDGSSLGRREPYIHFRAERRTDGNEWEPLKPEPWGICNNSGGDWRKDVIELKPGESLPLSWFRVPFSFQHPGATRITAHYECRVPPAEGDRAYHITSAPLVLAVSRPLDLTAEVIGTATKGVPVDVGMVVKVALANRTDRPLTVAGVGEGGSRLSVLFTPLVDNRKQEAGVGYGWRGIGELDSKNGAPPPSTMTVNAGERAVLLGGGVRPVGKTTWTPPKAGRYRVTVEYWPMSDGQTAPHLTAEAEVVVEP